MRNVDLPFVLKTHTCLPENRCSQMLTLAKGSPFDIYSRFPIEGADLYPAALLWVELEHICQRHLLPHPIRQSLAADDEHIQPAACNACHKREK